MAPDWRSVRAEFPALQKWAFLNSATYGQMPKRSTDAVAGHFVRRDELACADFLEWFDDADELRGMLATLVNCSVADVAFVPNASTALALLMGGLDWKTGDVVVALENEFPNNLYAPAVLRERGVEFREVPWECFYDEIDSRTRLVLMSTANYSNGFSPPLMEVSRFLRERGVLLYLDGTQSVGALRLDVKQIQPDMLAVHGYKWLLSPDGAGFMYISPALRKRLPSHVVGWRSDAGWRNVDRLSHGVPVFVESAEKYEGAMLCFPSLYGMRESVRMILELGLDAIERRVRELSFLTQTALERAGARVAHPGSHILAALWQGVDASALARRLKDERIIVSARHGRLRVSVHFYNNEEDIARLSAALEG